MTAQSTVQDVNYHQENRRLVERYRAAGTQNNQNRILEDILELNKGLIQKIIREGITITDKTGEQRRVRPGWAVSLGLVDYAFLQSCGQEGLINAAKTYDPEHESRASFITHATYNIVKAMQNAVREIDNVPEYMRNRARQIKKLREIGKSEEEISRIYVPSGKMYADKYYSEFLTDLVETINATYSPESLETLMEEDTWFDFEGNLVEEPAEIEPYLVEEESDLARSPVDYIFNSTLREQLERVLATLSKREKEVLKLRFGLDPQLDGTSLTLEEVGHIFEVTRGRIRQIEAKALKKLRHPSRSKRLRDYAED